MGECLIDGAQELKALPCKRCGRLPVVFGHKITWGAECQTCGLGVRNQTSYGEAIHSWNKELGVKAPVSQEQVDEAVRRLHQIATLISRTFDAGTARDRVVESVLNTINTLSPAKETTEARIHRLARQIATKTGATFVHTLAISGAYARIAKDLAEGKTLDQIEEGIKPKEKS